MRPIKLTMQAFGPFAKKIEIEFDKLGLGNIFLISGVTGSGKTTIFDAICFALFNSSSGSNRGSATLKSHFVDDNIESFVEFIFEFNCQKYKIIRLPSFERKKARGEGYILEQAKAQLYLPDGKIIEKVKDVDDFIEDLLGVNVVQFSQIALLAQGEFLKLLNSDTVRRGEVFRNIFKTWKYADFSQKLKDRTYEIKSKYEALENSILQYINDISPVNEELKNKKENFVENKIFVNLGEIIKLLDIQNNNDDNILKDFEKEVCKHEQKLVHLQLDFQKIQNKTNLIFEKENLKLRISNLISEFSEIEKEFSSIDKLKTKLDEIIIKIEKNEDAYKKACQIQELNIQKNEYIEKNKVLQDALQTLKSNHLQSIFNDFCSKNDFLSKQQEEFLLLQKDIEEKSQDYNQKYNQYLELQAGILAKNLVQDNPCPVCGSLVHPKPAKLINCKLSKEEIDDLKLKLDKLNKALVEKSSECSVLVEQINNLKIKIEQLSKDYQIKINKQCFDLILIDFENEIKKVSLEAENSSSQIILLESKIQLLNSEIDLADIEKIKILHAELQVEYEQTKHNIADIEKKYNDKNLEIQNLKSNLDLLEKQISEIIVEDIDVQKIEAEINDLKRQLELLDKNIQDVILRKGINDNILKSLTEKNKEYLQVSKQYSDYKLLSDCANGNLKGKQRLAFEQYIQGYYLDLVLIEANKYLKIMSQNQFQLLRKKDDFALNSKSGLELEVMDFHTFKKRSTKTLSGGESFKAALSLALGLSNCVSSLSGALNIDALFIDEGFGSLDSESLELAVDVILDLTANNRLIGVISHIEELKNKIQNQIIVQKTQNGSDLSVNF